MSLRTGSAFSFETFRPSSDFFIGIDSDGCVFDTMEVKHKECFIPNIIKFYNLAAVSRIAREVAEFVNLYSRTRGINRFPGIPLTFDLLAEHPEIIRRGFSVPNTDGLRSWLAREKNQSNPTLQAALAETGDPDLKRALEWSLSVNRSIEETVKGVPPFRHVRETLEFLNGKADLVVISATPTEALVREWSEHQLDGLVHGIAGQEFGVKRDIIASATQGRYSPEQVLMIGDAPGDLAAAVANQVLFYPISPCDEEQAWERLKEEALPRFFRKAFAGNYMNQLIESFQSRLPETPAWKTA